MSSVENQLQNLVQNANRIRVNFDLRRLCHEQQSDSANVDWRVFPRIVSFDLLYVDDINNLYRSWVGAFECSNMKICVQVYIPRTVAFTNEEVLGRLELMITEIMCRPEFNQESLRGISSVALTTYYCGFVYASLVSSRFDINVFGKSVQQCVDTVCTNILAMAEYNDVLDDVIRN